MNDNLAYDLCITGIVCILLMFWFFPDQPPPISAELVTAVQQ